MDDYCRLELRRNEATRTCFAENKKILAERRAAERLDAQERKRLRDIERAREAASRQRAARPSNVVDGSLAAGHLTGRLLGVRPPALGSGHYLSSALTVAGVRRLERMYVDASAELDAALGLSEESSSLHSTQFGPNNPQPTYDELNRAAALSNNLLDHSRRVDRSTYRLPLRTSIVDTPVGQTVGDAVRRSISTGASIRQAWQDTVADGGYTAAETDHSELSSTPERRRADAAAAREEARQQALADARRAIDAENAARRTAAHAAREAREAERAAKIAAERKKRKKQRDENSNVASKKKKKSDFITHLGSRLPRCTRIGTIGGNPRLPWYGFMDCNRTVICDTVVFTDGNRRKGAAARMEIAPNIDSTYVECWFG